MKYLFILGRNPELSIEEIKSYFEKEGNEILELNVKNNSCLVELRNPIGNIVDRFGGVISIGEVMAYGKMKDLLDDLEKENVYNGVKNNINYCVWDFAGSRFDEFIIYLKKRFKGEKLKAVMKNPDVKMTLQSGGVVSNFSSSRLIDYEYFLFEKENVFYFGKIVQQCDYENLEKRDMEKPVRREELSISPRLAKIMINLSGIKKDESLIDGFCGVGVILGEALLQGIRVVGVDKNKDAIKDAQKNLKWLGINKKNYILINKDSKRARITNVNSFVSEPDLGKVLKKTPTKENARKTLEKFEDLMINVINNFRGSVKGKFVFTAPLIRVSKERMKCDIEKICEKTGFSLRDGFPIPDFRKNQFVGREIVVLE